MIEGNLIHEILEILKREKESLSDYCYEYITALLMNLSLRASGKDQIEFNKELAFEVLIDLIECQNEQIRTFVNGTLYSLLSRKSFCDYANHLGLNDKLQELYNNSDERFQKQILYMINQLNKEEYDIEETLSDQIEENDVDDIDDEDEVAAEDDDDDDLNDLINGENLLQNDFQLSGPEAQKQKFITDSIVLKELQSRAKYRDQQQGQFDIQAQGRIQDFEDLDINNSSVKRSQQLDSKPKP